MTLPSLSARCLVVRRTADTMEALESRVMLANTTVFTDTDGDQVTVRLSGPGTATPTLSAGASGFIDLLTLQGTTGASVLTISVKAQGGDGRVSMFDMTDGALRSVIAPSVDVLFNAAFTLTEITRFSVGDIGSQTDPTLFVPAGKSLTISAREIRGDVTITGRVRSITCASANGAVDFVSTDGPVDAIVCAGDMAGRWSFSSLGALRVGGVLSARLIGQTPDAKGYLFGALRAQSAAGATLGEQGLGVSGRVKSLTVGSWTGGDIRQQAIDTLRVVGDFTPTTFVLDVGIQAEIPALKAATIGGLAGGEWLWQAPVGTLRIARTDANLSVEGFGLDAPIGTLAFTGAEPIVGSFTFASIRTLTAKSDLGGDWRLPGADAGLAVRSISAPRLINMRIDNQVGGGIGSITTSFMQGVDLRAVFFNSVNVRKSAAGTGDAQNAVFRASGQNAAGLSIGTFKVAGAFDVSTIFTRFDAKALSFGALFEGVVYVGHFDPFGASLSNFGDVSNLDALRSIDSFTVTGAFNAASPVVDASLVTTAHLNKLTIKGAVRELVGFANGFTAGTFGPIRMRDALGAPLSPTLAPGDTFPFAPALTDFAFRVVDL